jgi:hypothetical protein
VTRLIAEKQAEIAERIAELAQLSAQLDKVRSSLEGEPPPAACQADLSCCVPASAGMPVALELTPRRRGTVGGTPYRRPSPGSLGCLSDNPASRPSRVDVENSRR